MNNRKGGWQCWVDIYDTYVVKTPKSRKEIEETVSKYLNHIGKIEELKIRVSKMLSDVNESKKIIQKSRIPRKIFGSPKFKSDGIIIQQKVIELSEFLKEKSEKKTKEVLIKLLDLIKELWGFGIHEKTFKFFTNYGIIGDRIILMDFLEVTNKQETVEKQLHKGSWNKPERFSKYLSEELKKWFIDRATIVFSLETFDKHWKKQGAPL